MPAWTTGPNPSGAATKDAPVWSRDYFFGRTDENSASPLPPPNLTPWLSSKQVGENNAEDLQRFKEDLRSQYPGGYLGEMMYRGALMQTPEVGNLHFTGMGVDWSQQRTSGTKFDAANDWGKVAPDPNLIGKEYGSADALRNSEPVPAGMVVNPFWKLPGQEPFITQEAYDALAAQGLIPGQGPRPSMKVNAAGQLQAVPLPDAYDATVLTAMRKGETNAATLGYDPSAPFQRENDYYDALKMRNDLSNATAAGYKTTRMPDGTFQVVGLTNPGGLALSPNELGNQTAYIIGSPPYGENKPGENATVTMDPLNYLFSQEINPSQARFMPGYTGKGAEPVFAPYGAQVQKPEIPANLPMNDPGYTGPGSYADGIARAANDPTLAHLYANQNSRPGQPGQLVDPNDPGRVWDSKYQTWYDTRTGEWLLGDRWSKAPPPFGTTSTPAGSGSIGLAAPPYPGAPVPAPSGIPTNDQARIDLLKSTGSGEYYTPSFTPGGPFAAPAAAGATVHEDGSITPPKPKADPVHAYAQNPNAPQNTDGFYMGIPLADWRKTLDSLGPDERDRYLAANPLLAEKLLRGYWSGGVTNLSDPVLVGEQGPEIVSKRGGRVKITPMPISPEPNGRGRAPAPSPTLGDGYSPWYSQDVTNRRNPAPAPAPEPGSPDDMSNPWSGKALQLPDTFWQMTPLDQQAYLERLAGDKYNPAYLGQMAQKYKLAGVSGWNNVTGY